MTIDVSQMTLEQLTAQAAAIAEAQKKYRQASLASVLATIAASVAEHKITRDELLSHLYPNKTEDKYKDPVSGATWNGRGARPKWIPEDKAARAAFLIEKPAAAQGQAQAQGELSAAEAAK